MYRLLVAILILLLLLQTVLCTVGEIINTASSVTARQQAPLVPVVAATSNSALAPSTPKVTIGGVPATDVTIVDSNTITVKVPAHPGGSADITIDLGDGDPHYKVAPATPGSGGAGSANGGNGQRYRGSRPGGTLANTGDNLTILLFAAGVLIAGALTLIIGVRLRKDWQV